jgi:phosphoribosylglycinamide formyltransferase-1
LDAITEGRLDARVGVVVSNQADARGLQRAEAAGVPTAVVSHKDYDSREAFDEAVLAHLKKHAVDIVCLAGFMRILSPVIVRAFANRVLNIHPSLLPAFVGLHAQRQAVEHGVKVSGCTVHLVDEELDHGPILAQASVRVEESDSEESLSARILEQEHELYPQAIQLILDDEVRVDGRRAVVQL